MFHTILFTGHMIDAPGRTQPRFPPEKEAAAKEKIRVALLQAKAKYQQLQGIAGAACGGDTLFLETCVEMNIPAHIYLALPPEEFKETSVSFAGPNWVDRYDSLLQQLPYQVLAETNGKNIWEATNETMLQVALHNGGAHMTLLALWNGQGGDGPGGTQHLVQTTKRNGASVIIIPTQDL
jgi:hypothetical protein